MVLLPVYPSPVIYFFVFQMNEINSQETDSEVKRSFESMNEFRGSPKFAKKSFNPINRGFYGMPFDGIDSGGSLGGLGKRDDEQVDGDSS